MVVLPTVVDDLGIQGCLALSALLAAQRSRVLVTPTRRMTLACLKLLADTGVIELPGPGLPHDAPGFEQTPMELLGWRLSWFAYETEWLEEALNDYLAQFPSDDYCRGLRLELWCQLAVAESQRFFTQQLDKNQFDVAWAADLAFAIKQQPHAKLSISQWRYCAWAAVRKGASTARLRGATEADTREAIYRELGFRASRVNSGAWPCALPPSGAMPESAIGRAFTRHLARLGFKYWNEPPNIFALGGWIDGRP